MPWITTSTDFYLGPTTNLTGPTIPDNRTLFFIWKSLLKSAGWTVPLSWRAGVGGSFSDLHVTDINGWFVLKRPDSDASFFVSASSSVVANHKVSYCVGGYQTGSILDTPIMPPTNNPVISGSTNFIFWNSAGALKFKEECHLAPSTNTITNFATTLLATATLSSSYVHMFAHTEPPYSFHVIAYPTGSVPAFNAGLNARRCSYHFGYDGYMTGSYEDQFETEPYAIYYAAGSGTPLGVLDYNYHRQINLNNSENPLGVANNIDSLAREELRNRFTNFRLNCFWPGADGNLPAIPAPTFNPTSIAGSNRDLLNDSGKISIFPTYYSIIIQNANGNATAATSFRGQSSSLFGLGTYLSGSEILRNGTVLINQDGRRFAAFGSYAFPWNDSPVSGGHDPQTMNVRNEMAYTSGSSWFDGKMAIAKTKSFFITGSLPPVLETVYRGVLAGNYVYSVNEPPIGATDIVIISPIRK